MNETLFAGPDHLGFRMIDDPRLERIQLPEDDDLVANREVLFHVRKVPPPAMQPRGAVVEDELEDGFGVTLEPLDAQSDHGSAHDGGLIQLQFGNGPQAAAVLIPPRPVKQQVLDRVDLEPRQKGSAFGTHSP